MKENLVLKYATEIQLVKGLEEAEHIAIELDRIYRLGFSNGYNKGKSDMKNKISDL